MRALVFPSSDYPVRAAETVIEALKDVLDGRRANLGLAGGSTPRPVYEQMSWSRLEWEEVDLWLSDERWVPPDHPDSNGRMVAEALASRVGAVFHRPLYSDLLQPEDSAAHYEAGLRRLFDRPDLVLLGMGEDGHTASLFPDTDALHAPPDRWYVANWIPQLDAWRLTATPALIRRAHRIIVLVTGSAKAELVAEVLEGDPSRYPIGVVAETDGDTLWLLDDAAAARLSG
ncbi:MAG: 6-phosphogluconolactonase [Acidimicrobiia bacterium]|nr:MAG: 6-phosphogluconolactonase [Acidimicrobiia bacterium]